MSVCLDEGICNLDELTHDCDGGDLCGFSGLDHGLVFDCHVGIEACCDESRHIERIAQMLTPTLDEGLAFPGAARLASSGVLHRGVHRRNVKRAGDSPSRDKRCLAWLSLCLWFVGLSLWVYPSFFGFTSVIIDDSNHPLRWIWRVFGGWRLQAVTAFNFGAYACVSKL